MPLLQKLIRLFIYLLFGDAAMYFDEAVDENCDLLNQCK